MVLAGTVNKQIVTAIQQQGGRAVGISGKDGGLIRAEKMLAEDGSDIGFVGAPAEVDIRVLERFLDSDFIPIVAPVAWGHRRCDLQHQRRHRGRRGRRRDRCRAAAPADGYRRRARSRWRGDRADDPCRRPSG